MATAAARRGGQVMLHAYRSHVGRSSATVYDGAAVGQRLLLALRQAWRTTVTGSAWCSLEAMRGNTISESGMAIHGNGMGSAGSSGRQMVHQPATVPPWPMIPIANGSCSLAEAALLVKEGLTPEELKRAKAKIVGQKKIARQELGDAIWGRHHWDPNMLHRLVRRLKEKVEPDPAHPHYLQTVPGVGYVLTAGG